MASKRKKDKIVKLILIIAVVLILAVGGYFTDENPIKADGRVDINDAFSVHFIDVGQGDCTLIKTNKGNMLIDAGENGMESTVINYLEKYGIETITYLVATHPHSDHIGGMQEVINRFDIENVIMPRLSSVNTPTTQTYENMLSAIKDSGAKVIAAKPSSEYKFGDVSFKILSPFTQDENLNNMSVSLKLTYGEHSFMFTGDAESEVEKQILNKGYDIKADVYKAAHHASTTSNTKKFVQAIDPDYAVISCGAGNSYGHPHDEIIELFDQLAISHYTTMDYGSIVFTVENQELLLYTEN